ncbi:metal-dependent transcriptional regulator [Paeniglutamicibacter cryotolerans]|uniref:Manganese transport regulator n=1 Tax=Paeniglutamicibacter cryotolerans TaxID=670079 RepID=A0A839QL41_9MICC|nr:metal-dependent transcriptional regulator [Paeniglutamicibacter cryotolerans]MBB2996333.1 DtxR family Mn-dependent transcriptional regulator [Paeniglutamicibacter cryotolerans]
MSPDRLSSSEEDYLKTVYGLTEWEDTPVTTGALAVKLELAPASVTMMVRKLVGKGLLVHPPYGAVTLTALGLDAALSVVRRHRLVETFLVNELGYGWDEVHDEAERIEHAVSEQFVRRLEERLGFPTADPHGDPIPAADGSMEHRTAIRLDRAAAGLVMVVRINDAAPQALRQCLAAGIAPGSTIDTTAPGLDPEIRQALWVVGTEPIRP